ncbi:MAG: MoaD/ThiS family protein [Psychrobium sp.]|nr:MoaD/ThiS family protein [Psychrobium sp.]
MIKVSFFAALREQLNCSELNLDIALPLTVAQVKAALISQQPQWAGSFNNVLLLSAVNHQMVDDKYNVNDGDQVAFFPPVTGG